MSAVERLAAALALADPAMATIEVPNFTTEADAILAADPDLEADMEHGQAFREAVAALPKGWWLAQLRWDPEDLRWEAVAWGGGAEVGYGYGATPTEALRSLAAKLREADLSGENGRRRPKTAADGPKRPETG